MFGRSRPVVFDPYGSRRSRRRVPAWLAAAVLGIAIGAGGVVFVQERYLAPRLSAEQSTKVQALLERSQTERKRLEGELAARIAQLEAVTASEKKLGDELAAAHRSAGHLRADVASLVEALPPDPRGGAVAVRAARFDAQAGKLGYQVILTREPSGGKPFAGTMQIVVTGSRGGATQNSVTLDSVETSFVSYESLEGRLPLPEGFVPRQATVRVLERPAGKLQGMRVLNVR